MLNVHQSQVRLRADPSRVVVRPFHLAWNAQAPESRIHLLVDQVRAMDMRTARTELALVFHDFEARHWQTHQIFMQRYAEIEAQLELASGLNHTFPKDDRRDVPFAHCPHRQNNPHRAVWQFALVGMQGS